MEERLESGWVWWIMGSSRGSFNRVIGDRKAGGQEEGANDAETSMTLVTGYENG
jgi:hypothetical protein